MTNDFQSIGYAIKIIRHIHALDGRRDTAPGIAAGTGLGRSELGRILRLLVDFGILDAKRGVRGGYRLDRKTREISLLDVLDAVRGPNWLPECPLGLRSCPQENRCVIHEAWTAQREQLRTYCSSVPIDEAIRTDWRRAGPTATTMASVTADWR